MVISEKNNAPNSKKALAELKIKAKLALKSLRKDPSCPIPWVKDLTLPSDNEDRAPKLKFLLNAIARETGFKDWQHASHILDGNWQAGEDAGSFWYSTKCMAYLNIWCRDIAEAEAEIGNHPNAFLFPYKKQFVISDVGYAEALGLKKHIDQIVKKGAGNMVTQYGSIEWDILALARIEEILKTS